MRAAPLQTSFNSGEISPRMLGRVDFERTKSALGVCVNGFPHPEGPWTRRPAFYFCDEVKDSSKPTRLVRFKYNTGQAYAIEFGHFYVRFKKNRAPVYDLTLNITTISNAAVAVATYTGTDPVNGQDVDISGLTGPMAVLNGLRVRIANINTGAKTFQMQYMSGSNVDTTSLAAYTAGGLLKRVYTLTTPYDSADIFQLKCSARSVDRMYIFHNQYPEATLNRFSDNSWTHTPLTFLDGPYLPTNTTTTTLTPTAFAPNPGRTLTAGPLGAITNCANNGAGLIRVTDAAHGYSDGISLRITGVTGTVEANGIWTIILIDDGTYDLMGSAFVNAYAAGGATRPAVFTRVTDIGRLVRLKQGSTWGYCRITGVTDESTATVTIINTLVDITAKASWRLGLLSNTTGYSACGTFFGDRLYIGGNLFRSARVDGSKTSDYLNFAETATDSTTTDASAVQKTLAGEEIHRIKWMKGTANGIVIGTSEGEWLMTPSALGEAITPTNIEAKQSTGWGSDDTDSVMIGTAALFIQKGSRRVRELTYQYYENNLTSPDITLIAEHMTKGPTVAQSGLVELAYQAERVPIVWGPRKDGVLVGITYSREDKVIGAHRHMPGGFSDALRTAPTQVKSCCVIPANDGSYDECWAINQRYIGGRVVQYNEFMTNIWERGDDQVTASYVDGMLTYSGVPSRTITGLHHLVGETIDCLVNGATHPQVVVQLFGVTTLQPDALLLPALTVQMGYSYNSDGQMLRLDAGSADGTAQGKLQRTHHVFMRLHDTGALQVGPSFTSLTPLIFRTSAMPTGQAVPLFSGDKQDFVWKGDYTTENYVCWRVSDPTPCTILCVGPRLNTEDP